MDPEIYKYLFGIVALIIQFAIARIRERDRRRTLEACDCCRDKLAVQERPRFVPPALLPLVVATGAILVAPGCRDFALALQRSYTYSGVSSAAAAPAPKNSKRPSAKKPLQQVRGCDDNNPCPRPLRCVDKVCTDHATEKTSGTASRLPSEDSSPYTRPVPIDAATYQLFSVAAPITW